MDSNHRWMSVAASASLVLGIMAGATAPTVAAAPLTDSVEDGVVRLKEGQKATVTGRVPAKYAGHFVAFDVVDKSGVQRIDTDTAGKNGDVRFTVSLGGDGDFSARFRVIRGGRVVWSSKPFALKVTDSGRPLKGAEAADRISDHAGASTPAGPTRQTTRAKGMDATGVALENAATNGVKSAVGGLAKNVAKKYLGDLAGDVAKDVAGPLAAFGVGQLLNLIWPTGPSAEMQKLDEIDVDIRNGFAEVNTQLRAIESDLRDVETRLESMRTELANTDANAANSACIARLAQADGLVTSIQDDYQNYMLVHSPAWLNKNVAGQSAEQARKLVGEQVYGRGASAQPTYSQGVIGLQKNVSSLRSLLADPELTGLLPPCATETQATIAASGSGNEPGAIVALGTVEDAYFERMDALTSHYVSWLRLGQTIAAEGRLMVLAELADSTPSRVCRSAGTLAAADDSCDKIKRDLDDTRKIADGVFSQVGASWGQVSGGLLAGDARVDSSATGIQWPRNAWVRDLASYAVPPGQKRPVLSSLKEADSSHPQASYTTFATKTAAPKVSEWMGATFSEARRDSWARVIPLDKQSSLDQETVGDVLFRAGLSNGGKRPEDLLLYTGDTFDFQFGKGTDIDWPKNLSSMSQEDADAWQELGWEVESCGVFLHASQTRDAAAFVDVNSVAVPGESVVVDSLTSVLNVMPYRSNQAEHRGQKCFGDSVPYWNIFSLSSSPPDDEAKRKTYALPHDFLGLDAVDVTPAKAVDFAGVKNETFYRQLVAVAMVGGSMSGWLSRPQELVQLPDFVQDGDRDRGPQWQYVWPTLNLTGPDTPCTMTSFSYGAGNVCQDWFNEYAAGALGVSTGHVSVSAAPVQGTDLGGAAHAATVVLSNDSGDRHTVSVTAEVPGGGAAQLGSVMDVDGYSVAVQNCTAVNVTKLTCSVTIPAGASAPLTIPIRQGYRSSTRMTVSLAGDGSWDSVRTTVTPYAARAAVKGSAETGGRVPTGLVGKGASVHKGAEDRFAVDLSWTEPEGGRAWGVTLTSPDGEVVKTVAQLDAAGERTSGPRVEQDDVSRGDDGVLRTQIVFPADYDGATHGVWKASLSTFAASSNDSRSATTNFVYESVATPMAPRDLVGMETRQGGVRLSWVPVLATPPVSDYTVTATSPSGESREVTTSASSWDLPVVRELGMWEFEVIAENAAGRSKPAVTTVNVTGTVPSKPTNLRTSIAQDGWISLEFDESPSVPAATSYWVALYAPFEKDAIVKVEVLIPEDDEIERIFVNNFYQLVRGEDPIGTWRLEVLPVNATGPGRAAGSSLYVSQGTLDQAQGNADQKAVLASIPDFLTRYAKQSCTLGLWDDDLLVFGTCDASEAFMPAPDAEEPVPDPEGSWADELPDEAA